MKKLRASEKKLKFSEKKRKSGKKWKKGHSCVSNPESNKHRVAAKNRFFNVTSGPSMLTEGALAKHDATHEDAMDDVPGMDTIDTRSNSAGTFSTWATNWTDCTNITFNKVHRYATSNSAAHKSVLAVLAAITEVIKANDGQETDTEYFGALMTALDNSGNDDETIAAILYLLTLCIKKAPVAILRAKFPESSKLLMNILADHINTSNPALLRSSISCLAHLLRFQEQVAWSNASTLHVHNTLLTFTVHSKPKLRKAAQCAIVSILRGSPFMTKDHPLAYHPAASTTVKYCTHQIETCRGSGQATVTLHTLGLLQEILDIMPKTSLKLACETILKVMTLADVIVKSVSMKCLHKMFVSHPKASTLSAELNAQIITALYDFQPGEHDAQLMSAWLSVMKAAHSNLAKLNEDLFISHLPRYFTVAMGCLKKDNTDIADMAAKSLISLMQDDLTSCCQKLDKMTKDSQSALHRIFKTVENGLGYQFHVHWDLVMGLLSVVFEVIGKYCGDVMVKCLQNLSELRDSHKFPHKVQLDRAVGMAVRSVGPEAVLRAIPLQITGDLDNYDFPRSWMLPVLRENIRDTQLSFFNHYFLPLAAKLRTRAVEFANTGDQLKAKTYDALQLQIWSLLPGFCNRPTDLAQSFKSLAKILGAGLRDREDIRMDIMASLRKVILHNMDHETNRSELAKFAKNFVPLFFNLYTTDPEKDRDPIRMAVLETVKIYMKIADDELVVTYVDMCLDKLKEKEVSTFRRNALLDLLIGLVQHTDSTKLNDIYHNALGQLKDKDRSVQKKCYRLLEMICASESQHAKQFVGSHLRELQENLSASLSSSSPPAKAPRLRCLIHIFRQLEDEDMEFLQAVVPEAVLCTKEVAEKARQAAYALLVEMCEAQLRWNPTTPKAEVIHTYFELLLAGLAGSTQDIACTLLALARITYQFKDYMSDNLIGVLLQDACILVESGAREVVQAALALLKLILSAFDDLTIGRFLKKIVSGLVSMTGTNKHQLRFKSKGIFSKLVRKFGYHVILNMVPESHHKQLAHINKMQERTKRKKHEGTEADDDDDDEDEDQHVRKTKPESFEEFLADSDSDMDDGDLKKSFKGKSKKGAKKSQQGSTWLQESGSSVVDFLDPSVSHKIMSSKPKAENASKKSNDSAPFKVAPDGRMIIKEENDEETGQKNKGKSAAPIDDLDELFDAMQGPGKKSRKRKLAGDIDEEEEGPKKYQAGGHGIHRPVKSRQMPGAEYKSKKARGDIKKAGKPDPYAYIPLEVSSLNKRKRAKVKGQLKNFVRGAKKGAQKGQKLRSKKGR